MDILDNDVIKPLIRFKVSQEHIVRVDTPVLMIAICKETSNETRKQTRKDLRESAAKYADHAEKEVSKLQREYLRRFYPQEFSHSIGSQRSSDSPNKRFGGKVSTLFRGRREREPEEPVSGVPKEGIVDVAHEFQLGLLNLRS